MGDSEPGTLSELTPLSETSRANVSPDKHQVARRQLADIAANLALSSPIKHCVGGLKETPMTTQSSMQSGSEAAKKSGAVHETVSGAAWRTRRRASLASDHQDLRQPQDGAPQKPIIAMMPGRQYGSLTAEPEDARLTGGTRSLMRRVLGLNVLQNLRRTTLSSSSPVIRPNVA